MLIIGLTGGIGSGKSTVAGCFAQLGIPIIDADQLARELVIPGSPILDEIVQSFGPGFVLGDGSLDRSGLRQLVFANPAKRHRLEAILHPRIFAEMQHRTQGLRTPYCIWVVPLLVETGRTDLVDRVLVVDAPEQLQRERVMSRDKMGDSTFTAVLASQVSRTVRLQAADDVIVNNTDISHLQEKVRNLHDRYLSLANTASTYQKDD